MTFAITFMRAGVLARLTDLNEYNLTNESALKRLTTVTGLAEATDGAMYVQECAPEKPDLKRTLFVKLDRLTPPVVILASASSAVTTSAFAADPEGRAPILVFHPGNAPFLIPVSVVVPAPFTSADFVERIKELLSEARLVQLWVEREVEEFVFNWLQGAMLRETRCLVRDGVSSVDDIDRIVRDGVGLRWSVSAHLKRSISTPRAASTPTQKNGPGVRTHGHGTRSARSVDRRSGSTGQRRAARATTARPMGTTPEWLGAAAVSCR